MRCMYTRTSASSSSQLKKVMDVIIIPLLSDNYGYLLVDTHTKEAAAVDPVEPDVVQGILKEHNLHLKKILTTHSHYDHAGGNAEMAKRYPGIEIFGGVGDGVQAVTNEVGNSAQIPLGRDVRIEVIEAPCHTRGHVLYLAKDTSNKEAEDVLFTGDTLFVGGCGSTYLILSQPRILFQLTLHVFI